MRDFDKSLIIQYLEGSYTPSGIEKWFNRPRPYGLDGLTPNEALALGFYDKVLELAKRLQNS